VGTDHGAFWVSKNDGATWEEQSTGIASNYIRSISPSNHHLARVYMAMTGINYDDLHSYVYVSEDYGKNWKSIAAGLPDEPVNVIKEDPTNENILYAGTIRGVFVSTDRGSSWHYLGVNMPAAAVADLEIHEGSQDLVVATHGRGIYKTNLKPIQQGLAQKLPRDQDYLFEIDQVSRPWFNSSHGNVDYRTLQKVSFTYWLKEAKPVTLSVRDAANKEVWTTALNGSVGFNQFRWDLIVSKQESASPYFVHYDKFIDSGTYTLVLTTAEGSMQQKFRVVDGISPYLEN
jgi:ligand-binding sensor domain-containing protein